MTEKRGKTKIKRNKKCHIFIFKMFIIKNLKVNLHISKLVAGIFLFRTTSQVINNILPMIEVLLLSSNDIRTNVGKIFKILT